MHEYAATESLVNIALEEAKKAGAGRISEIRLVIGDLSSFLDESVQLHFDIISKGTIAENARLVFRRIPAEFMCKSCGHKFVMQMKGFDCPECGGMSSPTGAGGDFHIESIEID